MEKKSVVVKVILSLEERARLASFLEVLIVVDKRAPARERRVAKKAKKRWSSQKQMRLQPIKTKRPVYAVKSRTGLVFSMNCFMLAQQLSQQRYRDIEAHQHDRHHRPYALPHNVQYQ